MADPDGYDLFLSHNRADKDWVRELGAEIEQQTIDGLPGSRPLKVFFDEWDIDIGENIIIRLNDGLRRSRFVACVLSPEFMASEWTSFEWTHVVAGDPTNKQKRIIPLLRRDVALNGVDQLDLCAPFKGANYIDFRKDNRYKSNFERLIRRIRGLPPLRGNTRPSSPILTGPAEPEEAGEPDSIREAILGNLLPVNFIPPQIFSAETPARDPAEIKATVRDASPFILRNGRLYTFADLRDQDRSLRNVIDVGTVEEDSLNDWLLDIDRSRYLVDLLRRCLIGHAAKLGIWQDKKKRFYFRPDKGKTRCLATPGDRGRTVAAEKKNANDEPFWVHYGVRMRFRRLANSFFLCVDPIFIFTVDGTNLIEGKAAGKLAKAWGGKQQNDSALRNVLFWSKALAMSGADDVSVRDEILVTTGAKAVRIRVLPAVSRLSYGIEFDNIKVQSLINQLDSKELETAAEDIVLEPIELDEEELVEEE